MRSDFRLLAIIFTLGATFAVSTAVPALAAAPDTTIDSGPSGMATTGDATFAFSGDDGAGSPATIFECKLDFSSWASCTSPQSYTGLPDASHTFNVRAYDPSGTLPDPTPATRTWTVNTAEPDTSIDSGPSGFVIDTDANLTFSGTDAMSAVAVWGGEGVGDGQFAQPYSIAFDVSGDLLVADTANDRIQRFDTDGNYISQFGTLGSGPGEFNSPYGIAVDAGGDILVADGANNRVQRFDSAGNYLSEWGTSGTGNGEFNSPRGIAVGAGGNVFVADAYNHRIQKFDPAGGFLRKWGVRGTANGEFKYPFGIAVGTGGNVFVADYSNHRIQKFDPSGDFLSKWGTYGSGNGQLKYPYGVTVASSGTVYVADTYNYRIQTFDSSGSYLSRFGSRGAANGRFSLPYNAAIGSTGDVFVVDLGADRIEKFSSAVASFECRLDTGAWGACTSPTNLTGLVEGPHTFRTRAIDSAGTPDPTPASRSWTVDLTPPDTTMTSGPATIETSDGPGSATFSLAGDDGTGSGVASFECRLDAASWGPCTSPTTITGLGDGAHSLDVRAIDNVGNVDTTPASWAWTVAICTTTGTAGNDVLIGTSGADVICGLAGADILIGSAGDDVIDGGAGDDTLDYGAASGVSVDLAAGNATGSSIDSDTLIANENITGSRAGDTLVGDDNVNEIDAGGGADTVRGGGADDVLSGDAHNDILEGGSGNDWIAGLRGGDTIAGLEGNDTMRGGAGVDTATYSAAVGPVNVDLTAGTATGVGTDALSGIDNVIGSDFGDTIEGDANPNSAWGGSGNDDISAMAGNDNLYGEAGDDNLDGGPDSGSSGDLCVQGAGVGILTGCEVIA